MFSAMCLYPCKTLHDSLVIQAAMNKFVAFCLEGVYREFPAAGCKIELTVVREGGSVTFECRNVFCYY